jgi:RNA polymerase sigma-70 factor (ECF subfamily)
VSELDLDVHLQAIAAGDTAAFARWMAAAERPLRLGLRSFAAMVDTEAILQEALLRVWQVAPRFVPDGKSNGLLRLALRMARNLAVSELRRTKPDASSTDEELERELVDRALRFMSRPPDPMLRQAIQACRDLLPAKPRQALTERLATAGHEDDAVIAERLGMRANTFLQNFTRARKMLADCLKGKGIDLNAELV